MIQSARFGYALSVADYNMDRGMSISATAEGAPVVIRQSKGQKLHIPAMDGHVSVVTYCNEDLRKSMKHVAKRDVVLAAANLCINRRKEGIWQFAKVGYAARCQKRQTTSKDEHLKKCIRWKCRRCNKVQRVPKEDHWETCKLKPPKPRVRFIYSRCRISSRNSERHKEHQVICRSWKSPRCRQQRIPLQQKEAHRKACTFGACGKCGKQNIPLEQREVHRKECGYMVCGKCSTKKIPPAQYGEHAAKCALKYWCCPRCHRYHLSDDRFKHLGNCNVQRCPMCQKALKGPDVGSHLK